MLREILLSFSSKASGISGKPRGGGPVVGAVHPPAPISGWAKGINAKQLQGVNQCGGREHHVFLFSKFRVGLCDNERVVEIKTKQMEADKTRKEEAGVINWERRKCQGMGCQRGVSGDWTRWRLAGVQIPTGVSAAATSGAAASPAPLGFGLPWGPCVMPHRQCLCSLSPPAWGRGVLSLPVCPQRESVVPEWEDLWFHPTCFCPS